MLTDATGQEHLSRNKTLHVILSLDDMIELPQYGRIAGLPSDIIIFPGTARMQISIDIKRIYKQKITVESNNAPLNSH